MTNIFVGNLSYSTTQDELHAAFAQYGSVERVNIVTDRDSGQPRGFAFVGVLSRAKMSQLNNCGPIGSNNRPPVISGVAGPINLQVGERGTWTIQASDP